MYLFFRGLLVHFVPLSKWPKYFYMNNVLAKKWVNNRIIRVKSKSNKYFSMIIFESI